MKYKILQLDRAIVTNRDLFFADFDWLKQNHLSVQRCNYREVYQGTIPATGTPTGILEKLYLMFNLNIPEDYHVRSMSVSDVVILDDGAKETAYYCDSCGFEEICF